MKVSEKMNRLMFENQSLKEKIKLMSGELLDGFPPIPEMWTAHLEKGRYPSTPRKYFRCSDLGDECLRRVYYKMIAAKAAPCSPELLGKFDVGHATEEEANKRLLKMGFQVERMQESIDFKVMDQLLWRGHQDGVLTHYRYSGRWLYDIKSCHSTVFDSLPHDHKELSRYINTSAPTWIKKYPYQLQGYLSGIKQNGLEYEQVDGSVIIFCNKDNGLLKYAIFPFSQDREDKLVNDCLYIKQCVKDETPPPFCKSVAACEYCQYKDVSCFPVVTIKAKRVIDPEANKDLLEAMKGYTSSKKTAKLFDKKDKEIKELFKRLPVGEYVADGVTVKVTERKDKVKIVKIVTED